MQTDVKLHAKLRVQITCTKNKRKITCTKLILFLAMDSLATHFLLHKHGHGHYYTMCLSIENQFFIKWKVLNGHLINKKRRIL